MRKIYCKVIISAAAGTLLLAGCVKDDIYNTDHPDYARVTVVADWSDRGPDISKPTVYTISAQGVTEQAAGERYTMDKLFAPGDYGFYFYNETAGISIARGIASVNTVTPPVSLTGIFVDPLPGWLFTGTATTAFAKDTDYTLSVSMHQQVRQLTLILEPSGPGAFNMTGVSASLSGVAGALSIADGSTSGEAANVRPAFARQADGSWMATLRLIGIAGMTQWLSGSITTEGMTPVEIPLDSDLTAALAAFNANKTQPLTLRGDVIIEPDPDPAGITATIKNWEKVNEGTGTAD